MKTLKNKSLTMTHPEIKEVRTEHLVKECLNNPPVEGFSYEDMKFRRRIEDVVDQSKGKDMKFEDADAKKLQEYCKQMRWKFRHADIEKFCEDVEKLT